MAKQRSLLKDNTWMKKGRFHLFSLMIVVIGISLGGISSPAFSDSGLPPEVELAFSAATIPRDVIAIVVEKLDEPRSGKRLLSVNTTQPMNPASVMKLFTTAAALELRGPASTWRTEFRAHTTPHEGVLDGALFLKGSGDPKLNLEQFWLFLRQLRIKGVRDIRGNLVLDRSVFSLPPHDPAAFDGKSLRPYNAGADALLVNFGALSLVLLPDEVKNRVQVLIETPDARIKLINRLQPVKGECGYWQEQILVTTEGSELILSGPYPKSCGERRFTLAPFSGDAHVEGIFRALWTELGGTLQGQVVSGVTPVESVVLADLESPSLTEAVRDINKFSNNVMARQLFLSLSIDTPPATYEKSAAVIRTWLADLGINAPELVIENGSGLSRNDRASADTIAALLRSMWKSPNMPEMMASLPIAGEDGTMKKRGNGVGSESGSGKGRAHLKTGYLEGVRTLAGYLLDTRGERWLLVAMVNHPNAVRAKEGMDRLVDWVIRRAPAAGN